MRRRAAAADAVEAGRRRHRLSRDERLGPDARLQRAHGRAHGIQRRKRSHSSTTRWAATSAARGAPRRLGVEPAMRHERARAVGVRDRRRSAGRRARSTRGGLHDGRSRILQHARSADRERARLQRARHAASLPVCLVNEAFVRRHFKDRDPIGARLSLAPPNGPAQIREIVGVARQTSGEPDAPEELLQVYVPLAQFPTETSTWWCSRRPARRSADAARAARRRAHRSRRAGAARPDARNAVDCVDRGLSLEQMVGTFAALALVLAMVGVFGVLAYTCSSGSARLACAWRSAPPASV